MSNNKRSFLLRDLGEHLIGAEISVGNDQIIRLERRKQLAKRRAFLGVTVFDRNEIDDRLKTRVKQNERLTRQRSSRIITGLQQAMFGIANLIAIDDLGTITGDVVVRNAFDLFADLARLLVGMLYQRVQSGCGDGFSGVFGWSRRFVGDFSF